MTAKNGKKIKRSRREYRSVTRVQLDGWKVIVRMQKAHMDTAELAARLGRNPRSVRLTLAMLDDRTVNEGTALGLARALGCEVADIKRDEGRKEAQNSQK